MNPALSKILAILRQHKGRDAYISAPDLARRSGVGDARKVRRLLSDAEDDGTLEELEMPVVGIGGQGYFLAADFEDFAMRDNILAQLAFRANRKLKAWRRVSKAHGITITKP